MVGCCVLVMTGTVVGDCMPTASRVWLCHEVFMTTRIGTTDGSLFYPLRPPLFFRHGLTSKEQAETNVIPEPTCDFFSSLNLVSIGTISNKISFGAEDGTVIPMAVRPLRGCRRCWFVLVGFLTFLLTVERFEHTQRSNT
jgi:hypothetical protein